MGRDKQHETSGVYVLYAENGECLYVGSSINMSRRVSSHNLRKIIAKAEYFPCPREELRDREQEKIISMRPKLNTAKSISRPGQPATVNTVKRSFGFLGEDMAFIKQIQDRMAETQGPVSQIAAIRAAIRLAAKP